jgi:hypothetical protein
MMKRQFFIIAGLILILASCGLKTPGPVDYARMARETAAVQLDGDSNSAIDIDKGGTNSTTAGGARTALGLGIGVNVQAYGANLTTYAGITPSANVQALLAAADYAAMRTALGLAIGTNVQAYAANLTTYAGITPSANVQAILAGATYAAMRTLLDLEPGTDFYSISAADDLLALKLTTSVLGAAYDTEAELLALFNARALESVVGTELNADDLVNNGGVLETQPEIPHTDAAQTWPSDQSFYSHKLTILTSAPSPCVIGQDYHADNDTWDPNDVDGTTDYITKCTENDPDVYVLKEDDAGVKYVSGVATPTLLAAELNDTSNPHDLIDAELKNKIISNASGVMHLDVLAEAEGWNVLFHCGSTNNLVVDPTDSADWYLNGTSIGATSSISNTACTIGESMACYSTGTKVFCESKYSDFVDADD